MTQLVVENFFSTKHKLWAHDTLLTELGNYVPLLLHIYNDNSNINSITFTKHSAKLWFSRCKMANISLIEYICIYFEMC